MVEDVKELADAPILRKGDVVQGKITRIDDSQAHVDVGYKYEGVIPVGELSALRVDEITDAVAVGDVVEVKVLRLNDDEQKLVLSKKSVDSVKAWERLEQALETGETFEITVKDVVKGGLVADVGVRAFIPGSLVERKFVQDLSEYKGKVLRVKVIECDRSDNKVVLSQKAVLDDEASREKADLLSQIVPGSIIEGTVQRLTNFGAFVDIGGIDGLVHVSELSWNRVEHPSEAVREGDQVKVKVLKVDPNHDRVSLSIKETLPGPWADVENQFKIGDVVTGTVRRLVSFGAFVEVAPGIEGLVHISQVSNRRVNEINEVLQVGQVVQAKVLDVSGEEQRISLSIRDAQASQRKAAVEKFTETQNTTGSGVTLGDLFGDLFKK